MLGHFGKFKIVFLGLLIIGSVLIVMHDSTPANYITNRGVVFGTTYNIMYSNPVSCKAEIEKVLAEVDTSLSPFNRHSLLYAVNENRDIAVDSMFLQMFRLSRQVSEQTGGAFDVTVAPMVNAWGFGFEHIGKVNETVLDSLRKFVGYQKVTVSESMKVVKADKRIKLDFSAIAKGFGCDMVARLLDRKGVENYLIEIGGEIVSKGRNPNNNSWNIGISKPVEDSVNVNTGVQTVLNLGEGAMATSGNYRRFYYKDGRRYSHTIDPRTGYPVSHTMLSSTVVARNCALADAYATAFMVMGLDSAQKVLASHPELQAVFIYSGEKGENRVWVSPGLKNRILKAN